MTIVTGFVEEGGVLTDGVTVALYKESDMSLLGKGVTGAAGGTVWPVGDSDLAYSNANHTIVSTDNWRSISLDYALPTTGKYYVEMDISGGPMIGMRDSNTAVDAYIGQTGNAASVGDGNRVTGFFSVISGSLGGNSNIQVCADMDAGRLYFYRAGSLEVTMGFTANASGLYFAASPYPGRSVTVKDAPTSVISGYTYITTLPDLDTGEYSIDTSHTGLAFLVFKSNTTATPPGFTGAENHKISRIYIP